MSALTGDTSEASLVSNLSFIAWYPKLRLIVGVGQVEANRPKPSSLTEWPFQYFCYELDKNTIETFSDIGRLEAVLMRKGLTLEMQSPEALIEDVERKISRVKP